MATRRRTKCRTDEELLVQCSACSYWFEAGKVGLESKEIADIEKLIFHCSMCKLVEAVTRLEARVASSEKLQQEKIKAVEEELEKLGSAMREISLTLKGLPKQKEAVCKQVSKEKVVETDVVKLGKNTREARKIQANDEVVTVMDARNSTEAQQVTPKSYSNAVQGHTKTTADNRKRVLVIGDSQVGAAAKKLNTKQMDVRTVCLVGAGVEKVSEQLEVIGSEKGGEQLKGCIVVVHVGGNDISKFKGRSEELVGRLRKMVKFLKEKKAMPVISEITPRNYKSSGWTASALSINDRLRMICKKEDVTNLTTWQVFYKQGQIDDKLYKDDVHFSNIGDEELAGAWTTGIEEEIRKTWKRLGVQRV